MADNAIQAYAQAMLGSTSLECGITQNAAFARLAAGFTTTTYTSSGALSVLPGYHLISVAGVGAMTLVPPTAAQVNTIMYILSNTANAHTVTVTEGFGGTGTTGNDVATFGNLPGNGMTLIAINLHWFPIGQMGVTIA